MIVILSEERTKNPQFQGEDHTLNLWRGEVVYELARGILRHFVPQNDMLGVGGILRHFVPQNDMLGTG